MGRTARYRDHRRPARGIAWTRATGRRDDALRTADRGLMAHASLTFLGGFCRHAGSPRSRAILRSSRSRSSHDCPVMRSSIFTACSLWKFVLIERRCPPSIRRADKPSNERADGSRQLALRGHGRSPSHRGAERWRLAGYRRPAGFRPRKATCSFLSASSDRDAASGRGVAAHVLPSSLRVRLT